jgi:stearoyl-CoA desaturase (delta-9 desaturase)
MTITAFPRPPTERVTWLGSLPFLIAHLVPFAAIFTGVSFRSIVLCAALFVLRMFFITAGYHRYFSHKSYKVNRVTQAIFAFAGTTAVQKGPLWWAAHHRAHHRWTDMEQDPHTPLSGFWWSHVGWILSDRYKATDFDAVADLARYPELRFLERFDWIGPWLLGIATFLIAGWSGVVIGFFLSTVLLWHATFSINSVAHVLGRRRYATADTSRNSAVLALVTLGEGWHNNHHHFPSSAKQGFFWWEIDLSWYVLWALSVVRVVKEPRRPPASVLAGPLVREGIFDRGMFRSFEAKATRVIAASRHGAEEVQAKREALHNLMVSARTAADDLAKSTRRRKPQGDAG